MSIFGKIGKVLKKAAPVIGFVVGNAIAPGIGGTVGAGLGGAISNSGKGKSVGDVALGGVAGAAGGYGAGKLGGVGGVLGKIGGAIKKNPLEAAQLGMAGLSAIQGAQQQSQADKARRSALAMVGPPPRMNLSNVFASDNPYR